MRLREFTNAKEQLGLLRRIIDSAWTAIADEAAEQKEQERLERAKSKPKASKRGATTSSSKRTPPPPQPRMPPKPKSAAKTVTKVPDAKTVAKPTTVPTSVPPQQPPVSVAGPTGAPLAGQGAKPVQPQIVSSPLSPQPAIRPYDGRALRKRYGLSI
jgi:hypothetical protein